MDEYDATAMMFHQKFRIQPNKQTGFKRLVGQEVETQAYSDLVSIAGSSGYAAVASGLVDVNGAAVVGSPVVQSQTARRVTNIVHGPQTPKLLQPALDLWIPLIFWFNKDARLSVASVSIPLTYCY